MLISILGCPCSGKTTTAAMAFAYLKEKSILSEFVPEQARFYIANKKVTQNLTPNDTLTLTDEDQINIMEIQLMTEQVISKSVTKDTIIICDSSAINSLFYMSETALNTERVKNLINQALDQYDAIYFSRTLNQYILNDSNRIHDETFSKNLDENIPAFCANYLPNLKISAQLTGSTQTRMTTLVNDILLRATM